MIRNASHGLPHRVLRRMPPGAPVPLKAGPVWSKLLRKWMPAGWVIPTPLSGAALVALNGGRLPTRLLPAADRGVAA